MLSHDYAMHTWCGLDENGKPPVSAALSKDGLSEWGYAAAPF